MAGIALAGEAPSPVAAFVLTAPAIPADLTLAGVAPSPVASFSIVEGVAVPETPPVETDSDVIDAPDVDPADHEADWHPDVAADLPETLPLAWDVARAFTTPVMVGTQAVYTVTEARTKRHVDRILVKGAGGWAQATTDEAPF